MVHRFRVGLYVHLLSFHLSLFLFSGLFFPCRSALHLKKIERPCLATMSHWTSICSRCILSRFCVCQEQWKFILAVKTRMLLRL